MADRKLKLKGGGSDGPMDKMKKLLSSPGSRRKNPPPLVPAGPSLLNYFGVPLEVICRREARDIPSIITKCCLFIYNSGLRNEGLFRVNGNARVVEALRAQFDETGDADLCDVDDVMAVAGLLKLYLRELPQPLIPEKDTQLFLAIQIESVGVREEWLKRMSRQLSMLPRLHYLSLCFVLRFLVLVTKYGEHNKMTAMALGVVFGPNMFRCASGIQGLKDQGITNHIVLKFITEYDTLFLEEKDISPSSPNFNWAQELKRGKIPPARPPPPKVETSPTCSPPIPSPRKSKMRGDSVDGSSTDGTATPRSREELDDDYLDTYRSASPFALESDRSECATSSIMSPLLGALTTETVEKAISSVISERLFGDVSNSISEDNTSKKEDHPQPAPRRKHGKKNEQTENGPESLERINDEEIPTVKQRMQKFQAGETTEQVNLPNGKPSRQKPKSRAFELFEQQNLVISPAPESLAKSSTRDGPDNIEIAVDSDSSEDNYDPSSRPALPPRHYKHSPDHSFDDDDYEPVGNPEESSQLMGKVEDLHHTPLNSFKRAPGPKNRRNPSRQTLRRSLTEEEDSSLGKQTISLDGPPKPKLFLAEKSSKGESEMLEDLNHNDTKPRIDFLRLHPRNNDSETAENSLEKSPMCGRKPYIPPLDLSILHEHIDSADPIPAEQGPSISLQKAKPYNKEEDGVMVSPRMSKLKKKNRNSHGGPLSPSAFRIIAYSSVNQDTDVPPSPPTEQSLFSKSGVRQEDIHSSQIKSVTKRIQSCKRKIKQFEEEFEGEYGYRPSQTDKASKPDIKKCMQDLSRARKELRKLKEEAENNRIAESMPSDVISISSKETVASGDLHNCPFGQPTMEDTLDLLMRRLDEKRYESSRPEDLSTMSRDQVQEEKLTVQKALLHFESIHGRPSTKSEKELMKPLYDRYRNIKRLLTKPLSPRDKANELQSVPEDYTMEFASPTESASSSNRDAIHVPTGEMIQEERDEFLVTRDPRLLRDVTRAAGNVQANRHMTKADGTLPSHKKNLHELTTSELFEEQFQARNNKKRLRKILKDFEEEFMHQHGRKVQKDERSPMESEYYEYKQIKARLKLVDALISKHEPMASY